MIIITCTTVPCRRVQFNKKNRVECVQKPASSLQLDWKALSSKAVKITEVKGNELAAKY